MDTSNCPLCIPIASPTEIWRNMRLRIISVADGGFPGYTRVIWNEHVTEMTDLEESARIHFMNAVWIVETVMRATLAPIKVNLAQFGNQVPHLHWHVIPRWRLDTHFPNAVWAQPQQRERSQQLAWQELRQNTERLLPAYHGALRLALDRSLAALSPGNQT